jgi:hypothetical protein
VHELVHESDGQRAHIPAYLVAELGALDVVGRGRELGSASPAGQLWKVLVEAVK